MSRVWTTSQWLSSFDATLDSKLDTEDKWTLNFNHSQTYISSTEEQRRGWKVYKHWAYGRFCCSRCSRKWNSAKVVLSFRYQLRSGDDRGGAVTMRPYGQACRGCRGGFQLPGFSQRQVIITLDKLFDKIRRNCYDEDDADGGDGGDERPVARRHEARLCEACREGICAGPVKTFDWVVSSTGYAQAQHKAGYVLTSLSVTEQEKEQIERDTVGQSKNPLWSAYRKNRITASNFGLVLGAVERSSYPPSLFKTLRGQYRPQNSEAVQHGIHHEPRAKQEYLEETGMRIQERGVFLSNSGLLGASPDGTVDGGDRNIEVKCPYTARNMTVRQAVAQNRIEYLQIDEVTGALALKPGHNYWHQIQGALHLSGANSCDLVIWTPGPRDLVILKVAKDPTWAANIGILETFYEDVFLPRILPQM